MDRIRLILGCFVLNCALTTTGSSLPNSALVQEQPNLTKMFFDVALKNVISPLVNKMVNDAIKNRDHLGQIKKSENDVNPNWLDGLLSTNHRQDLDTTLLAEDKIWNNCDRDMNAFKMSIMEPWMLEVLDSVGKPPSGILRWNLFWPGDYDECLEAEVPQSVIFTSGIKTKYCLMKVEMSDNFTFESGICVPSTCDSKTIESYTPNFKHIIEKIPFLGLKIDQKTKFSYDCFDYDDRILDGKAIFCIVFLSLLGVILILGTSYETYLDCIRSEEDSNHVNTYIKIQGQNIDEVLTGEKSKDSKESKEESYGKSSINESSSNEKKILFDKQQEISSISSKCTIGDYLLCFSIWKNTSDILNTSETNDSGFKCLHGLRVLTMSWVVLSQTYFYLTTIRGYASNPRDILSYSQSWHAQVILRGGNAADTFLVTSGFLLTYYYLKNDTTKSIWFVPKMYLHRYIRLSPSYYLTIFVYVCIFPYLGDGPYWRTIINSNVHNCQNNWWYNLLYINNFQSDASSTICMRPSWYLSLEMQFLIISPLFLILLKCKRRYLGLTMITALLIICWLTSWFISYSNDLNISMYNFKEPFNETLALKRENDVFEQVLIRPYTRIGAFLIGSLLGFFVERINGAKDFLPKWLVITIWSLSAIIILVLSLGLHDTNLGSESRALYNTLSHSTWAFTIAWLIFACLTDHSGPVDRILSWDVWIPLSRMTYGTFLGHIMVLELFHGSARVPIYFTNTVMVIHYLGYLMLCYGIGFILCVIIEIPISNIYRLYRKSAGNRDHK